MRAFFTENPLMKVLSFLVAVGLWWVVHEEQIGEMNIAVKVVPRNMPENLMISGDVESEIRIRVVGPRSKLKRLSEDNFPPYTLDLAQARQGTNAYSIYAEDFSVPRDTRVTRILPQIIRVSLDQAEERLVRVEPKFTGSLEEGFELGGAEISPPYLKVKAAKTELEALSTLRTEPISLVDRENSFEGVYRIQGYRSNWVVQDRNVSVKVTIHEREISKIVEDVPVLVEGANREFSVEPSTVALRVKGPAGKVSSVIGENLDVLIDAKKFKLEQVTKNSYRIRPLAPKRPGVEITMIPDNVRVTFSAK